MCNRYVWSVVTIACAFPVAMSATLLVVNRNAAGDVILAADSLITHENGRVSYACKIDQTPRMFWAVSGPSAVRAERNKTATYNLREQLAQLLDGHIAISPSTFDQIKMSLLATLRRSIPEIMKENTTLYESTFEGKQITFIIVSRRDRMVFNCDSKVFKGTPRDWVCDTLPGPHGASGTFIGGNNDAEASFVSGNRSLPVLDLIRKVFPLSASESSGIGGQTSILSIPVHGRAMWIEEGECGDINHFAR